MTSTPFGVIAPLAQEMVVSGKRRVAGNVQIFAAGLVTLMFEAPKLFILNPISDQLKTNIQYHL